MPTIITPSGNHAHANPDAVARHRADRLAKATSEQIEKALAYLSMIDPEAFEIAFTAVTTADDEGPGGRRAHPRVPPVRRHDRHLP